MTTLKVQTKISQKKKNMSQKSQTNAFKEETIQKAQSNNNKKSRRGKDSKPTVT